MGAERTHQAQLDAVLQDAAAHEAAAVSAAVAVTATHLTRGVHMCLSSICRAVLLPCAFA